MLLSLRRRPLAKMERTAGGRKFSHLAMLITWRKYVVLVGMCLAVAAHAQPHAQQSLEGPPEAVFFHALNLNYPGLAEVRRAVEDGNYAKAAEAYLAFRRDAGQPRWFVNPADKPPAPDTPSDDAVADRIVKNDLPDYGDLPNYHSDGFVPHGDPIQWEYNPIPISDPSYNKEYQIAVNRLLFWEILGSAYWKTGNEAYAKAWARQLIDWITHCPQPQDPMMANADASPWRTLDTGIRVNDTWPNAYARFLLSPSLTPSVNVAFAMSMMQQARWLVAGLEPHPERSGNWVVTEASGLFTVSVLFPEFLDSGHFRQVAMNRLKHEMERSVYPDGMEIEMSTHYHDVASDDFAHVIRLARMNHIDIEAHLLDRLRKMYLAEVALMDQKGHIPMLNDGLPMDFLASIRQAAALWPGDETLKFAATLGREGVAPPASTLLPYAGFAVMRSGWASENSRLIFLGGPAGSGHWHEDKLSLDLSVGGENLLTEAGHYTYDSSLWRYYVLTTEAHSTVTVDGKGQHRGGEDDKVEGAKAGKTGMSWMTSDVMDFASASYDQGYLQEAYDSSHPYLPIKWLGTPDTSVTHTRQVIFLKPSCFLVLDFMEGTGRHRYDAYFHLDAPDAEIDPDSLVSRTLKPSAYNLELVPLDKDGVQAEKVKGQENPMLGWLAVSHTPIPVVVYSKTAAAPAVLATLLAPYRSTPVTIQARSLSSSDFWARSLEIDKKENVEIFSRASGTGSLKQGNSAVLPSLAGEGQLFVLRHRNDSRVTWVSGYGVRHLQSEDGRWSLESPSSVVLRKEKGGALFCENPSQDELDLSQNGGKVVRIAPGQWVALPSGEGVPPPTDMPLTAP